MRFQQSYKLNASHGAKKLGYDIKFWARPWYHLGKTIFELLSRCDARPPIWTYGQSDRHVSFTLVIFHLGQPKIAQCIPAINHTIFMGIVQISFWRSLFHYPIYIVFKCKTTNLNPNASNTAVWFVALRFWVVAWVKHRTFPWETRVIIAMWNVCQQTIF